jgi:hypothetical protein
MSISISRRKPLFTSASKSSVFTLDFIHYLFGFGRGGEVGGVDHWADPAASSRDLFFPAPVFMLFQGRLHPANAPGFHSQSLRGFSGGKQRRRAWICSLRRGGSVLGWLTFG